MLVNIGDMDVPVSTCNYKYILFIVFLFSSAIAAADSTPSKCVLKVFVNDPFAKIFVDDKEVGLQPQMISCAIEERHIVVKASDGQIFSRVMKSATEFDLENNTLNVVFHTKAKNYKYENGVEKKAPPEIAESAVDNSEKPFEYPSPMPGSVPSVPVVKAPKRNLSSMDSPTTNKLAGTYVQLFALKNLDMSKVEQDIEKFGDASISQQSITVCPWQRSSDSHKWSRVLIGPFENSSAAHYKNLASGSFLVVNPGCSGGFKRAK